MDFFQSKPDHPGPSHPLVVGHRGNPDQYPDNSLAGIISGLEASGAVEVDVRVSGDGHLVLSHDPTLNGLVVAESSWTELAEVDLGSGHRPCLLDEVLALGGGINLEVKNLPGQPGFHEDGRLALMVASRARPTDVLTSFYWPDMDIVRRLAPQVSTGLLVADSGSVEDALSHCRSGGHAVIAVAASLMDDEIAEEADRQGVAVICWTVNELFVAFELARQGASAIISDKPHYIMNGFRGEG